MGWSEGGRRVATAIGRDAGEGRTAGGAQALTVVMPIRPGRVLALGAWLTLLRLLPDGRTPLLRRVPLGSRHWAVGTLDRLRFVSAIRWSLLPPFAPRRHRTRQVDEHWHLLFESNFDGDWDDYLDAFGAVMAAPLATIVGGGRGFPGLDDIDLFKAYAKRHDVTPVHYVSAYPELTAGDIHQALLRLEGRRARRTALERGYGRSAPSWTTFRLRLAPGRASAAVRAAMALDDPLPAPPPRRDDGTAPLLLWTGLVHFARVAVLTRPTGDWLLVSVTHDGPTDALVDALEAVDRAAGTVPAEAPGGAPVTRLQRLLATTAAAPEAWAEGAVGQLLHDAVPRSSRWWMAYCGYPGRTVTEVRALAAAAPEVGWPAPEQAEP